MITFLKNNCKKSAKKMCILRVLKHFQTFIYFLRTRAYLYQFFLETKNVGAGAEVQILFILP